MRRTSIKTSFRVCALVCLTVLAGTGLLSCASTASRRSPDFAERHLQTIEQHTLANGIPVIIKKNPANRVYNLKVVFDGGVRMISPAEAGIESLTLALMSRGSEKYSFDDITHLAYQMSSGISAGAVGYDFASFDLNTIDKYWGEMFPVFADCLLNPAFDAAEFEQLKSEALIKLQNESQDAYTVAVNNLNTNFFGGHPYEANFGGTIESISSLTRENVLAFYRERLKADRMFVVAVGNFDSAELLADLEKTLGTLPRVAGGKKALPDLKPAPAVHLVPFEQSEGIAYVRANFPIAHVSHPDFVRLQLAFSMLNELLFDIVRTEHGACYSVWSNAHGFDATYGSLVVYKTDQPENVKYWVDEAIAILASGQSKNIAGGDAAVAPLAETIEAYKAKYINGFFSAQQTNGQMAAQLASSYIYFGDYAEYLRLIGKIRDITPEDIVRVIDTYVVDAPMTWIILADTPTLQKVDTAPYKKFTAAAN